MEEIIIGNQIWSNRNLDIDTFRNGEKILQVNSNEEWEKAGKEGKPAWCFYENDPKNGAKYGKLYNWYAASSICPSGWHLPNTCDFGQLLLYVDASTNGVTNWNYNCNFRNACHINTTINN